MEPGAREIVAASDLETAVAIGWAGWHSAGVTLTAQHEAEMIAWSSSALDAASIQQALYAHPRPPYCSLRSWRRANFSCVGG